MHLQVSDVYGHLGKLRTVSGGRSARDNTAMRDQGREEARLRQRIFDQRARDRAAAACTLPS